MPTSAERFLEVHPLTAEFEGGWSDHKADPGGKTMYGVTQAVYHAWLRKQGKAIKPVRGISKGEALEIYKAEYWNPLAEKYNLAIGVDRATYDAGVNSGVSRARKWLIASVGDADHSVTVRRICKARLSFMQSLRIWKTFGRGWARRVAAIEAKAVSEAILAQRANTGIAEAIVETTAAGEAKTAQRDKKEAEQKAAGSGAGAGGAVGADQLDPTMFGDWAPYILVAIVAVAAVAIVGVLVQASVHKARAEEYAKLAGDAL